MKLTEISALKLQNNSYYESCLNVNVWSKFIRRSIKCSFLNYKICFNYKIDSSVFDLFQLML